MVECAHQPSTNAQVVNGRKLHLAPQLLAQNTHMVGVQMREWLVSALAPFPLPPVAGLLLPVGGAAGPAGVTATRCKLHFELPLAEVITDFFDEVKSRTSGYASLDYKLIEYRPGARGPAGFPCSPTMGGGISGRWRCGQPRPAEVRCGIASRVRHLPPRMGENPNSSKCAGKVPTRSSGR